jgi:hypothetical protein
LPLMLVICWVQFSLLLIVTPRYLLFSIVIFYKITHDLIDINAPSYLLPGDARTRGANIYRQPTTDKDIYKFSFFPRTTTDWNRLPETNLSWFIIAVTQPGVRS